MIRIATVGPRDTIATLSGRMAVSDLARERFVMLNGAPDDQPLVPGTLVKLIAAA